MSAVAEREEVLSIEKPQLSAVEVKERSELLEEVKVARIIDQATYDRVVEIGHIAHALGKKINARYDPRIAQAHEIHKGLIADKKIDAEPVAETVKIAGQKVREWDDAQKAERQRLEAKAQAEADRLQAEADRIEAERQASERKRIEDERIALAEQLKAQGAPESVTDDIIAAPIEIARVATPMVLPKAVAPTFAKAAGVVSGGFNYSVEIVDLRKLLIFALTLPDNMLSLFVQPNQVSLNAMARKQEDAFSVTGTRLVKEPKRASFR